MKISSKWYAQSILALSEWYYRPHDRVNAESFNIEFCDDALNAIMFEKHMTPVEPPPQNILKFYRDDFRRVLSNGGSIMTLLDNKLRSNDIVVEDRT